jgi:endonuclease YncB( thermonuclease family)
MHGKCQLEKDKAKKAKLFLTGAIKDGTVIELRDTSREKYGRLIGDMYIDGKSVGDQMIASGLAVSYHGEKKTTDWCK